MTVKLQLQLQKSTADRQYKGPIDCARQIVRAHGVLGLWTGFAGSLAFRSNFLWMFGSFEVSTRVLPVIVTRMTAERVGYVGPHAGLLETGWHSLCST